MSTGAALVTGASSGIGLAIARMLGEEGYALTIVARRPEKLEAAAASLAEAGYEVEQAVANLAEEEELKTAFARHADRYGRLDVLVNNAGLGIGRPIDQIESRYLDMQHAVNIRATVLGTREGLPLLRQAASERGRAMIFNTSSYSALGGQPLLSVYGATKAAIRNFSEATQKEVGADGIKVTALCPGFVETEMTDFIKEQVPPEKMIRPEDVSEAVRFALRTSPYCLVPEIVLARQEEITGGLF